MPSSHWFTRDPFPHTDTDTPRHTHRYTHTHTLTAAHKLVTLMRLIKAAPECQQLQQQQ